MSDLLQKIAQRALSLSRVDKGLLADLLVNSLVTPSEPDAENTALEEWIRLQTRSEFPESTFVGSYEKIGVYAGMRQEQWLWAHRELIRGTVLDMSTPRFLNEWIYQLPTVEKVMISDLDSTEVEKLGYRSPVDIRGDFAASEPPVALESMDTVLCLSILEHCDDPFMMVTNLGRILRPGGIVFFSCPFAYIDGHMGGKGPDYWRFCRDGFLLMARKAGLEVLETGRFGDLGRYFVLEIGKSIAANSRHRGVPRGNWMICRRPKS